MFTNKDMLMIAMGQTAIEYNCTIENLMSNKNTVTKSVFNENKRAYLPLPLDCSLVYYGNGIVAQTNDDLSRDVQTFLDKYPAEHCFETPNMHVLDEILAKHNLKICFMAEYFLPDISALNQHKTNYELRMLDKADFKDLYLPEWSNALCKDRQERDEIAVGAYENGKLIGLAGASSDCKTMYQIGIDVLPEYRGNNIATALVSQLAIVLINMGKVPFYCAAWSNIKSVRTAIKCGFRPAWIEMTARPIDFVKKANE